MTDPGPSNPFEVVVDRDETLEPPASAVADPGALAGALVHQRRIGHLLPGATPPSFAFGSLTRRPDQVGLTADRLREVRGTAELTPIGPLSVPETIPRVTDPVADDPLVAVSGPGLRVLGAYRTEGWPNTVSGGYLRASVVERLARVAAALPDPFALAIFDAWRPLALQAALYDAAYADPALPPGFVAEPDPDPATPPAHLTGATVDLTLSFDGVPLALGTGFDDFTAAAHADRFETDAAEPTAIGVEAERRVVIRDLRRLLVAAMGAEGFVVLHNEWWHFEHGTRYWAAVTGASPRFGPATLDR